MLGCSLALSVSTVILHAQSNAVASTQVLPYVLNMGVPFYPPIARAARIEGVVHISVTTDGDRVVATRVEDGPRLLAEGAEKNAKTWEFAKHSGTTFTVTYRFRLTKNSNSGFIREKLILQLPTEIEVLSPPNPPLDSSREKSN